MGKAKTENYQMNLRIQGQLIIFTGTLEWWCDWDKIPF
jgi:hypothetical protein